MGLNQHFSTEDLSRIKTAVQEAEEKISGEIVPVIVERSGTYSSAHYKCAIILGLFVFTVIIILDRYVIADASYTLFYDPIFIFLWVVAGGIVGSLIPSVSPAIKRFFAGQRLLDLSTKLRAETAFLEEEVFNTKQRTGIMIFISFFEHEVIVMADKGISKLVDQKTWDKIVQDLITDIRRGKMVNGLETAIQACGNILLANGFHKSADDINELGDDLRIN